MTYIISVSISKNMTKNDVISKVSSFKSVNNHSTELIDTIIRVTPKMSVNLKEVGTEKNFHIDTITPTVQKIEIEDTTLTIWQWRVTPIKDGNKVLTITVNLYIGKVEKNLEIYDGKIYVHMNHKIWVLIGNFFVNYWQWLCSAAIFPFLIWIFKVYIQPKFKKKIE